MCLGIPGQVMAIDDAEHNLATVDIGGNHCKVNLTCVVDEQHPIESCLGDWVLVHVGFAMSRIDETEAARTLALLAELGEFQKQQSMQALEGGS